MGGPRTCLLILGMHRSGTSAITRILNLMGAELPKQVLGAKPGNEAGHWEPERLVLLHDQMLAEAGSSWRDLRALDLARLSADRLAYYKLTIQSIIQEEFGDANVFVLKDPRICRFIPLYRTALSELGVQIRPIIMIRNPLEVSASLLARDNMSNTNGLLLWLRHCLDVEKDTREMNRVFVSYDHVVNDVTGVMERLRRSFVGYPVSNVLDINNIAVRFISSDLRHQAKSSDDLGYNSLTRTWINQTYRALQALLTGSGEKSAITRLDRISNEFSAATSLLAQLADDLDVLRIKIQQHDDNSQLLVKTIEQLRAQIQLTSEQHAGEIQRKIEHSARELQRIGKQHAQEIQQNAEQHAREIRQNTDQYARELAGLQRVEYERRLPPELSGLRQWLSNRSKRHRRFVQDFHKIARSPLFDKNWYLRKNPDVAAANVNAALHYLQRGGREGRSPGPFFQASAHLRANPEVAAAGANPLLHFLATYKDGDEAVKLIRQSPLFDADFYLRAYPDLAAAGVDPAVHYFLYGAKEGRNPGPFFVTSEYLRQNPDVEPANMNALYHYESRGREEGRLLSCQQTTRSGGELNETTEPQERAIKALDCYGYITCHPELEITPNPPLDVSVSVVIPTYNAGSELRPLVRKLLAQKGLKSIEVVIVDSGSTDGTAELSVELGCRLVRITQSEFSHSYSRNVGADAATGELFVFMVQDAYPIGEYWLFGLARCLFRPQLKEAQLSAVSCAEYPRMDSELVYDSLLKAHYDFIGCSDRDRIGYFQSNDHTNLRSQGQLSDITCAIRRELFNKYRYYGQYAEDLTLGIRLIRDGHLIGMLSSIRTVHSHRRETGYYLRRAFVDITFLCEIFPDYELPENNCLLGTLVCSVTLWKELRPLGNQDVRPPARVLEDYIAELRQLVLPNRFLSLGVSNGFGYDRLTSWMDSVNLAAIANKWKLDKLSLDSVNQTRNMFVDRLSSLVPFLAQTYPLLDDVVAAELNDAIQKTLAMTIGLQLAYCCLRPRSTIEDSVLYEMLHELKPIIMAGV
jgi:glycosyltransferase involved in cell wall biosynthesis